MKKFISYVAILFLLLINVANTYAKEVLPEYPLLKVIKYDWSAGDYMDKNTVDNKTAVSNKFIKVMNEEEKAVDKFLNSKALQVNKDKAFLKHMHNVQVVATDLAQVVDWIIYGDELQTLGKPHILNKTLYGIEYQFQERKIYDEGEYFYSYGGYENNPKIVKYPMIELKNNYGDDGYGTEIHTHGKRLNSYYIDKYRDIVSNEAISKFNQNIDLSTLDYEAQKGLSDYLMYVLAFVLVLALVITGYKFLPKEKIKLFLSKYWKVIVLHVIALISAYCFIFVIPANSKFIIPLGICGIFAVFPIFYWLWKYIKCKQFNFSKVINFAKTSILAIFSFLIFASLGFGVYKAVDSVSFPKCDSEFAKNEVIEIWKQHSRAYNTWSARNQVKGIKVRYPKPEDYKKEIGYDCSAQIVVQSDETSNTLYATTFSEATGNVLYNIRKSEGKPVVTVTKMPDFGWGYDDFDYTDRGTQK